MTALPPSPLIVALRAEFAVAMSARSPVTRISKSERTSWFTEDSTERNDCQSTAAATPVCFAWWKIRSKEFAALRTARSAPSCRGFVPLSLRYNFLMCQYRDKEAPKLTESGFQFLLMDTNAQLWYIIREYISNSEDRGVDAADLISFMLESVFMA